MRPAWPGRGPPRARCRRGRPVAPAAATPASLRASMQQVVDQALRGRRSRRARCAGWPRRRPGPGASVDLELGPHAGEWGAQLVGGVGDEALLAPAGLLEAVEHLVHRAGQPGDLVVAGGLRDAPVEVVDADRGDLGADALHRPQRAPDQRPHHGGQQHGGRRDDHRQRADQGVDGSRRCRSVDAATTTSTVPSSARATRCGSPVDGRGAIVGAGAARRPRRRPGRGDGDDLAGVDDGHQSVVVVAERRQLRHGAVSRRGRQPARHRRSSASSS